MHVYILENLPLEGSYVGDLLYLWYALRKKKNAPFLSFLESKKKTTKFIGIMLSLSIK